MHVDCVDQIEPAVLTIQSMLTKIDRLHLPSASRRDLESILVRQVSKELDRLFPWQAGHGQETAAVAIRIGQAMQLDDEAVHHLKLAALLHDIGLLMLPSHLQTRQGSYNADSYVLIQNHPRLGAILLEPFRFLREATVMVAHHHERWDGSGYPYGLRGKFIPLGGRILAVADAFEAIRVPHVCDQSTRDRIALRILQIASGTQFDPLIVDALVGVLAGCGKSPPAAFSPRSEAQRTAQSTITPLRSLRPCWKAFLRILRAYSASFSTSMSVTAT